MKTLGVIAVIVVAAQCAADHAPTGVWWNGWRIESSEEAFLGRRHGSYPLTYMFDGKPATAWVYSGRQAEWSAQWKGLVRRQWHGDCAVSLEPDKPIALEGIRIMNGYNKSKAVFAQNDRVAEVEIWSGSKGSDRLVKRVNLADKMGWHAVSLPARKYARLTLVFTKRFVGKEHDLCISELELWAAGRKVDLHVPKLVMSTDGGESGDASDVWVTTLDGRKLACDDLDDDMAPGYSPDGTCVAGISFADEHGQGVDRLWVFNVRTGKRLVWRRAPADAEELSWSGNSRLIVTGETRSTIRVPSR